MSLSISKTNYSFGLNDSILSYKQAELALTNKFGKGLYTVFMNMILKLEVAKMTPWIIFYLFMGLKIYSR